MTRTRIAVVVVGLVGICVPAVTAAKQLWAKSFLNQKAPVFVVEKWITLEPQRAGKFLLIDFWATWCGPCLKAIPELNEIHRQFGDRVVVIGISDETEDKVRRMKSPTMEYAVAIDTMKRMKNALAVKGIPHVILVDPSGIVRWEGFPLLDEDPLTPQVVQKELSAYAKRPPVSVGGQAAEIGNYRRGEIEELRASLAKLSFPVSEGTVARLLPRPVKPLPVEVVNWMPDREKKGRVGGKVTEYWLKDGHVLKVATANYVDGGKLFSREEWAVILTKADRDDYVRPIYPGDVAQRATK